MSELRIYIKDHKINPNEKIIEIVKDNLLLATITPRVDQILIMSPMFYDMNIDDSLYPEKIVLSLSEGERKKEVSTFILVGLPEKDENNGEVLGIYPTIHELRFNLEIFKKDSNHIIECQRKKCKRISPVLPYIDEVCLECKDDNKEIIEYDKFDAFKIEQWNYNWTNRKYEFNTIIPIE
jgi:hypothetical protein